MRKLGLVAVIVLALLALSCETPVDDLVVNVRLYNDTGGDFVDNLRLGIVVFEYEMGGVEFPNNTYSDYKSIQAGTYKLEMDDDFSHTYDYLDETELDMVV